ncbi:PiggyBac transposable element-derived protein 4 [Plakobranchus ocellatus]|uniref:PiggyBac transposable element-derived protein 4 n=1 Tax=Plakobranchus ocellatus TaxID=259542 RepID=A0AAV4AFM5_9GAST|nr:PiggyBac transposable element-derived protein 4 [Plakobranchus ocellatus]
MHSIPGRCETSGEPEIVLTKNKSKGGVDTMDQMAYASTEKTKTWLLVVLFNIIDLSTYATRVIRQARLSEHKLLHDDNLQLSSLRLQENWHSSRCEGEHLTQPSISPSNRTSPLF